ncbi:MAG: allophanate hydrolase subunit 2 family protein, partial [Zoogloea sp.]
ILGPQDEHFTAAALEAFLSQPFRITRERDRMGMRLAGPLLAHSARGADIGSDGLTPGAIQVPADGQPILLLADCQTVGGYPKIATVIRADLPRLAHLQPGDEIRFRAVDADEAAAARAALARRLSDWLASARPAQAGGDPDTAVLLAANLAGAAVRGDDPHLWPD